MINNDSSNVLVSICCITYNQELYISNSIEGFLIQKTSFPFEILIHDDASSDNTPNIIREYSLRFPELIFPIFQKENQYSQGINPAFEYVFPRCQGKYIAVCEGDDYWTDPYKLQKQVDLLEANNEYSMCFHNVSVKIESKNFFVDWFKKLETRIYSGSEIFEDYTIPTCSVFFRNNISIKAESPKIIYTDIFLFLLLADAGKLFCINENMGVYRRLESGMVMSLNTSTQKKLIIQYEFMSKYFNHKYDDIIRKHLLNRAGILVYDAGSKRECLYYLMKMLQWKPKLALSSYFPHQFTRILLLPFYQSIKKTIFKRSGFL